MMKLKISALLSSEKLYLPDFGLWNPLNIFGGNIGRMFSKSEGSSGPVENIELRIL